MKNNNLPDWAKDIPLIRSAEITEIQRKIAIGEIAQEAGDQLIRQAALSAIADMLANPQDGEDVAIEMVRERYLTDDGQIVNPGMAKVQWDKALVRAGIDPKKMIEHNID